MCQYVVETRDNETRIRTIKLAENYKEKRHAQHMAYRSRVNTTTLFVKLGYSLFT